MPGPLQTVLLVITGSHLVVRSNTIIRHRPADQTVAAFSSVLMNCTVVADMTHNLTVMWMKNDLELGLVDFSNNERIDTDENYALRIKNVTLSDSGTYTCVAKTPLSEVQASGVLTVEGIPPLLAQPNWPADRMEGSNITLSCTILQGYPLPGITWYKDGHSLSMNTTTLHIPSAQKYHSGDYTCQAKNSQGVDSTIIPLRVRRKPGVLGQPVRYQLEEVVGTGVIFNCEIDMEQDRQDYLEIRWYKGEVRLNISTHTNHTTARAALTNYRESDLVMLPNSSLLISGVQESDLGHYSCQVITRLGPGVRSEVGEIFSKESELIPVIIILVVILGITVLLLGICLTCHQKGFYGVDSAKALEKATIITKVNRFPTHLSTSPIKKSNLPLKMQMTQLSGINSPVCSLGSLSSFEELLDSGMGEDGSFRGNYST